MDPRARISPQAERRGEDMASVMDVERASLRILDGATPKSATPASTSWNTSSSSGPPVRARSGRKCLSTAMGEGDLGAQVRRP